MPRKNVLISYQIVNAVSMAADITSATVDIQFLDNICIHAIWTGSPVGVLKVEGSIDGTNFEVITSVTVNGASSAMIDLNQLSVPKIRVHYVRTSGSGTLNAKISAKEI